MPYVKIQDATDIVTPVSSDAMPMQRVNGTTAQKITVQEIATFSNKDAVTSVAEKVNPSDNDLVSLVDSTDLNNPKKLKWSSIKAAIKSYYDSVTATLTNKTLTSPKINEDVALTSTATELNVLDGIPATLTATELGYVDGVTSAIQTQLNGKAALAGSSSQAFATGALTQTGTALLGQTGGNVGVGQPNPTAKLDIYNVGDSQWSQQIIASGTTGASLGVYLRAGTNASDNALLIRSVDGGTEFLNINGVGNVLIGSTTDAGTGKLQVTGGISATEGFGCNGKTPQTEVTVGADATDLDTALTLVNQLRAALIANGICV